MRVLMIAHIGETLGHLVRGLAIADELIRRGVTIEIAASEQGEPLIKSWGGICTYYKLRWEWSHNSCDPETPSQEYLNRICESVSDILTLLKEIRPDIIIGLPGFTSTQIARLLGIPHISILHGPYLAPIVQLEDPSPEEFSVIEFAKTICQGPVNKVFLMINQKFKVPKLDYNSYLQTETIFVPQPGLRLLNFENIHQTNFIRASFGSTINLREINITNACYITFGSGNPCDISRIIQLALSVYPNVIVTTGQKKIQRIPKGVLAQPFIASSSLAGQEAAVISHGGIGTVGTFAEFKTPQLIIPTELDQATMAVHAKRLGIAKHCGLTSWVRRNKLGRCLPEFSDEEFVGLLRFLQSSHNKYPELISCGASQIANTLIRHSFVNELNAMHEVSVD